MKIIAGVTANSDLEKLISTMNKLDADDLFDTMNDIFDGIDEWEDDKNDLDKDDMISFMIDMYAEVGMSLEEASRAFTSKSMTSASDKAKLLKTEKNTAKELASLISKESININDVDGKSETLMATFKKIVLDTAEANELGLTADDIEITGVENVNVNNGLIEVMFEFHPSSEYANTVRANILETMEADEPFMTPEGDEFSKSEIADMDNDEVADLLSDRATFPSSEYSDIPEASLKF